MKGFINYPRIANALYRSPWLLLPSMHRSLTSAFEAHISKGGVKVEMPSDDMKPEGTEQEQVTLVNATAIIPVSGVIAKHLSQLEKDCTDSCDCNDITAALKGAQADPSVSRILLWFNTPGGTVTGVPELAELIRTVDQTKPVYGFTDTLCASAGYWLALWLC
jgi:ClpP class serine protease